MGDVYPFPHIKLLIINSKNIKNNNKTYSIMITVIYDDQLYTNIYVFSTNVFDIFAFSMESLRERVLEMLNFDILVFLN